jgi:hypothetical protein
MTKEPAALLRWPDATFSRTRGWDKDYDVAAGTGRGAAWIRDRDSISIIVTVMLECGQVLAPTSDAICQLIVNKATRSKSWRAILGAPVSGEHLRKRRGNSSNSTDAC